MVLFKLVLFLFLYLYSVSYAHEGLGDYQYVESKRSLYKLHNTTKTYHEAKVICAEEGGYLLYPEDAAEAAVMSNIMSETATLSVDWVYVDISIKKSEKVIGNINGSPVTDVYLQNTWIPGQAIDDNPQFCVIFKRRDGTLVADYCGNEHYFFCKKTPPRVLSWQNECNMPNLGYKYDEASERCYKFHPNPSNLNWDEARDACKTEMSYLAIIDDKEEAGHLSRLIENFNVTHIKGDPNQCVYLGFHKINGVWQTIRGLPMTYNRWKAGEPNNNGGKENCGAMFFNGELNDAECDSGSLCFFICEHEVLRFPSPPIFDIDSNQTTDNIDDNQTTENIQSNN